MSCLSLAATSAICRPAAMQLATAVLGARMTISNVKCSAARRTCASTQPFKSTKLNSRCPRDHVLCDLTGVGFGTEIRLFHKESSKLASPTVNSKVCKSNIGGRHVPGIWLAVTVATDQASVTLPALLLALVLMGHVKCVAVTAQLQFYAQTNGRD